MGPSRTPGPSLASDRSKSGWAKTLTSGKHSRTRRNKCAWCVGFCLLVIIGANAISFWQTSDLKYRHVQKPLPEHAILRQWKDWRSIQDIYRGDGGNLSSPTPHIFRKTTLISTSLFPANAKVSAASPEPTHVPVDSLNPTDVQYSFFMVKDGSHSSRYTLCDSLELHIEARDGNNQVKQYGGDYFWVKIASSDLDSSQTADEIIDHHNGTYTARFTLHWTGAIHIKVFLIKSSEYVALLREVRQKAPARCAYDGKFTDGNSTEIMPCHITKEMFLGSMEPARSRGFCDFSNRRLGYPWFCLKPEQLPCSSLTEHVVSAKRGSEYLEVLLRDRPASVIHKFVNIKQVGSTYIEVISIYTGQEVSICTGDILPLCSPGLPPRPPNSVAGFYHQTSWQSLVCQVMSNFHTSQALKCLQGCSLYFYGDSTLRQWFEFLSVQLGNTMIEEVLKTSHSAGPRMSYDKVHNISLFYRHHGYPFRNSWTKVRDIRYAADQIDELPGGPNTIILLSHWAHFTPTNLEFYRDRWKAIKSAVRRLQKRAPGTPVIVKSANTREQKGVDTSNWYSMDLDRVMREELAGEPGVAIIDVWDMTLSHSSGYRIHPYDAVISQEIKILLSYLCPVH